MKTATVVLRGLWKAEIPQCGVLAAVILVAGSATAQVDAEGKWIESLDPKFDGGMGGRDYYDENNGYTYRWDAAHDFNIRRLPMAAGWS